ncbi:hypothetical protein Hanom_Chr04g00350381 [Helianthus anomalus]
MGILVLSIYSWFQFSILSKSSTCNFVGFKRMLEGIFKKPGIKHVVFNEDANNFKRDKA